MKIPAKENPEAEMLKLLDVLVQNQALFLSQQGKSITERLKVLISEQRSSFGQDAKRRLVLLFKLVLSCPGLLSKPPGFEWVVEEFSDALHRNLLSVKYGLRSQCCEGIYHSVDMNVFREAGKAAWGQLHRGGPKKLLVTQYGDARAVEKLMVDEGLSFPDAVAKVANQAGSKKRKGRGHEHGDVVVEKSTIYKSVRVVGDRERAKIKTADVYLRGVGLIKPKLTDLRSEREVAIRKEMLAKRPRGFPTSRKSKGKK